MSKNNGLDRLKQSQQATQKNLSEWRASRVHEQTLPSGLHVKLRDVSMTDLMFTGKLPDAIIGLAKDASETGAKEFDLELLAKNTGEFNQMLNVLVELCLVEPMIGAQADDAHILLGEIPADDKMAIFSFVNREAENIRPFRDEQNKPVETI